MGNYIISCCSTADMSHERYEKREIYTVPFHIIVGKDDMEDNIGVTITQEELFRRMLAGEEAHSSQVSMVAYVEHFEKFLSQGKDILHITLSSGISDASKDSSSMSAAPASVAFASTAETALTENITKSTINMVINIRLFKIIYSI